MAKEAKVIVPKERPEKTKTNRTGVGKTRLDQLLAGTGPGSQSRASASGLILAGRVLVREQKIDKPGTSIAVDSPCPTPGQ